MKDKSIEANSLESCRAFVSGAVESLKSEGHSERCARIMLEWGCDCVCALVKGTAEAATGGEGTEM